MNVKSVEKEATRASVTVELTREELEPALNRAYLKYRKDIMIPGFRKGHAPRMVIEAAYGKHVFFEDAVEDMFPDIYKDAVLTQDIRPVGRPSVSKMDIADDGAVTLTIVTDLYPVAELGEYKNLEIEKAEVEVKESEVEAELDRMAQNVARITTVDRPAQEGDTAVIDFEGFENGKAFAGGKGENYELKLGSHTFIPGFEEQLIGMNVGEEKDINVKFPEDYHAEELKGKDAVFSVKINAIEEKQLPEADDEFAKDVSEFDTLAEYKADIAKKLKEQNDRRAQNEYENALLDKICEDAQVDIPESMIERQIDYHLRDMEMRMSYQGLKMSDYLAYTGMTVAQLRDMYRNDAQKTVKQQLVLEAIKNAENIEADQESIDKEISRYAEMFKKDAEEYKQEIKPDELEYIKETVTVNNILDFIRQNNKPAAKRAPAKKKTAESEEAQAQEQEAEAQNGDETQPAEETKPAKPAAKKPRQTKKTAAEEIPAE